MDPVFRVIAAGKRKIASMAAEAENNVCRGEHYPGEQVESIKIDNDIPPPIIQCFLAEVMQVILSVRQCSGPIG